MFVLPHAVVFNLVTTFSIASYNFWLGISYGMLAMVPVKFFYSDTFCFLHRFIYVEIVRPLHGGGKSDHSLFFWILTDLRLWCHLRHVASAL